jgi:hypothetical protein
MARESNRRRFRQRAATTQRRLTTVASDEARRHNRQRPYGLRAVNEHTLNVSCCGWPGVERSMVPLTKYRTTVGVMEVDNDVGRVSVRSARPRLARSPHPAESATSHATRASMTPSRTIGKPPFPTIIVPPAAAMMPASVGLYLGSGMSPLGRPVADDAIALPAWLPNVLSDGVVHALKRKQPTATVADRNTHFDVQFSGLDSTP